MLILLQATNLALVVLDVHAKRVIQEKEKAKIKNL